MANQNFPTTGGTTGSQKGGSGKSSGNVRHVAPLPLIGDLPAPSQYKLLAIMMSGMFAVAGGIGYYSIEKSAEQNFHSQTLRELNKEIEQLTFAARKVSLGQDVVLPQTFFSMMRTQDLLDSLLFTTFPSLPGTDGKVKEELLRAQKSWIAASAQRKVLQDQHVAALAVRAKLAGILADVRKGTQAFNQLVDKSSYSDVERLQAKVDLQEVLRRTTASTVNVSFGAYFKIYDDLAQKSLERLRVMERQFDQKGDASSAKMAGGLVTQFTPVMASVVKIGSDVSGEAFRKAAVEIETFISEMSLAVAQADLANADSMAKNQIWLAVSALVALLALSSVLLMMRVSSAESARTFIQTQQEAEALQLSILELLDDIAPLADGDLTHKSRVNDGFIGAIADSMNFTIEELRRVIINVVQTAQKVDITADEAAATSTSMAMAAGEQMEKLSVTGEQIVEMAHRMNAIAEETSLSADSARQSKDASGDGIAIVEETISKMNAIRDNIQETSKKIKLLGESSTAIGEVTGLIRDITKQINILALNAAIQAASAGEAGRGFAVVAQEVQRLAISSADAAKKIDDMVLTIQEDAKVAVSSMEESTKEVVEGAKLTDRAGEALRGIGQSVEKVAGSILEVTRKIQEESKGANMISDEMRSLEEATQKSMDDTEKTTDAVFQVKALSEELKSSVANFKV